MFGFFLFNVYNLYTSRSTTNRKKCLGLIWKIICFRNETRVPLLLTNRRNTLAAEFVRQVYPPKITKIIHITIYRKSSEVCSVQLMTVVRTIKSQSSEQINHCLEIYKKNTYKTRMMILTLNPLSLSSFTSASNHFNVLVNPRNNKYSRINSSMCCIWGIFVRL